VFALQEPPRLVIDLPEVVWRIRPDPLGSPRGLATGHRFGKFDAGRSRLVVDAAGPFRIDGTFVLPPGDAGRGFRVVVDLRAGAAALADERTRVAALPPARAEPAPPMRETLRPQPVPRPGSTPPARPIRPVIAIDPGHGGVDPGTRGVNGVDEKDITLAMGLELRDRLLATGRYRVAMTRERDVYLPLRERIKIAREANAAMFLSLHADSIADPATRGASVYTLSDRASDAEAERLAAAENRADVLAGADLSAVDATTAGIMLEQARRITSNTSIELAEILVAELGKVTPLLRNTRRYAGFVVLKSPDTPSVLVELGYLSNRADARLLTDRGHRARLAAAIVRAVDRHFGVAN
jgi:N-acetylmuramoyl-L-alanine amidase